MEMNQTDLEILEYGKEFSSHPLSVYKLIEDHRRLRDLTKEIERIYRANEAQVEAKAKELLESKGYVHAGDLGNKTVYELRDLIESV